MILITNNPRFKKLDIKNLKIEYYDTDYFHILEITRDYVHKNYEILTHPLYGSVKPNETIYRTILVTKNDSLNYNSVTLISEAIDTFIKFKKNKVTPTWNDKVKDDFSVIDYDLLINAIKRIIN
ncbi:GrdX family protein [Gemella sp. GH3]|uniref:GrdX family protein n=1 Tax=unclassified Gemella TaxID=2624949 RepID=UPI0015CFA8BE|nr:MULTISPECIES: GrdX family protein [unclassified Gemella]MBF0713160.1 GrdX family protein [Gemella sp. GH3.1]NYS50112.1 GrdX family protein [Gemella sp. GH3]